MILRDLGKKIYKFDNGLDRGIEVEDNMKEIIEYLFLIWGVLECYLMRY